MKTVYPHSLTVVLSAALAGLALSTVIAEQPAESKSPDFPHFEVIPPPPFVIAEPADAGTNAVAAAAIQWLNDNRIAAVFADRNATDAAVRCRVRFHHAPAAERDYKSAFEIKPTAEGAPPLVVIYTAALAAPGVAPEQYQRRVNKETLRGVLLALGIEKCVFFLCNLYEHEDTDALDRKSTNPCPPCQGRVEEWLRNNDLMPRTVVREPEQP